MTLNHALIQEITVDVAASSVIFSSIPTSGYTDLKLVVSARDSSTAGANYNGYSFSIYPNGLNTSIVQKSIFGNGSGASSYSDTQMYNPVVMSTDAANIFSTIEVYVHNYRASTPKSFSIRGAAEADGSGASIRMSGGLWSSNSAITSLQLNAYSTFVAGSTFTLYGISKLGTTPSSTPKASGGDIVVNDGTYWYHAFISSGAFVPQTNLTADVLVVAGGGAGGTTGGGGGGAGGVSAAGSQTLTSATSYAATIGAGGAANNSNNGAAAADGVASSFASILSTTAGGGGGSYNADARTGGSGGGGGARKANPGGAGTAGQGYAGGAAESGDNSGHSAGGGGGGAGAAGTAGSLVGGTSGTDYGGAGGAGTNSVTNWGSLTSMLTATGLGVDGYIAGGGGGIAYCASGYGSGAVRGAAGSGGGGQGGLNDRGTHSSAGSGVASTGSGGGGGGSDQGTANPGNGASGVVVIRYAMA